MSRQPPYYQVRNLRTKKLLAEAATRADSFVARVRGLLGEPSLANGVGLWLDPCSSIHMFFMRFAIDVVFLDRSLRVTRTIAGLSPWRIAFGGQGARSALELPVGSIAESATRVGDVLVIEPVGSSRAPGKR